MEVGLAASSLSNTYGTGEGNTTTSYYSRKPVKTKSKKKSAKMGCKKGKGKK